MIFYCALSDTIILDFGSLLNQMTLVGMDLFCLLFLYYVLLVSLGWRAHGEEAGKILESRLARLHLRAEIIVFGYQCDVDVHC